MEAKLLAATANVNGSNGANGIQQGHIAAVVGAVLGVIQPLLEALRAEIRELRNLPSDGWKATRDELEALSAPFQAKDVEWRAGATNREKTKALALAYVRSRAIMRRLDEVVGAANWRDEYEPGPDGGVMCRLAIKVNGEWVAKCDAASNTEFEAVKGGISSAFKRAAVKWGIGRYLYDLPDFWVRAQQRGSSVILTETPELPVWALPSRPLKPQPSQTKPKPVSVPEQAHPVTSSSPDSEPDYLGWALAWVSGEDVEALGGDDRHCFEFWSEQLFLAKSFAERDKVKDDMIADWKKNQIGKPVLPLLRDLCDRRREELRNSRRA